MTALARKDFLEYTLQHWKYISPIIHEPQNTDDYEQLSHFLDRLLDKVGEDESHELIGLVDVIICPVFDEFGRQRAAAAR